MKKMKTLMAACMLVCMGAAAQTQQGYVKTLGRPGQKGMPLSGVSVKVKGENNTVLSKSDGTFAMLMKGKRNGDSYTLQEVKKGDYELNETGIVGRQYAYSDKVPITIVMVSSAQLRSDKQRIENNAYKVAEKNYKAKWEQLEKQKNDNAISEEQYRNELATLQEKFEKYQLLIDGLAEHYAHVDYDDLSDKEREINICIENGELECADSLLKHLFDPVDALKRNKEALSRLNSQISAATGIIDKANEDMAAVLKQQEKDANYLYQLYTIALANFDNEKAQKYIEIRAELDTINVEWQIEAGDVIAFYYSNYNKARQFYERGLRNSLKQNGSIGVVTAKCYLCIADYFHLMGDSKKGLSYYKLAESALKGFEADNPDVYAASLATYARISSTLRAQVSVVELYKSALNLIIDKYGKESLKTATYWGYLGGAYFTNADYKNAYAAYKECLRIRTTNSAVKVDELFRAYSHMGLIYRALGDYANAEKACKDALQGMIRCYGPLHKEIATCYVTLADISYARLHHEEALDYMQKAYQVMHELFGDEHIEMADMYERMSSIYIRQRMPDKAMEYAEKSLQIRKNVLEENSPRMAMAYQNIGDIAMYSQDYKKSRELLGKAWEIYQKISYKNQEAISHLCNDLGLVCTRLKSFKDAQKYFDQALSIKKDLFGENHQEVSITYSNMAEIYVMQGDYDKAIDCYNKTIEIDRKTIGVENFKAFNCNLAKADLWCLKGNNEKALEVYQESLKICKVLYGESGENTMNLKINIETFKAQPQAYKVFVKQKYGIK